MERRGIIALVLVFVALIVLILLPGVAVAKLMVSYSVFVVAIPILAFTTGGFFWSANELGFNGLNGSSPFSWRVAWIFGLAALLICSIAFILAVLVAAMDCATPPTTTGSVVSVCPNAVIAQKWYLVLHDWQTGIGATIGLLGVAWSAIYNKVFADAGKASSDAHELNNRRALAESAIPHQKPEPVLEAD